MEAKTDLAYQHVSIIALYFIALVKYASVCFANKIAVNCKLELVVSAIEVLFRPPQVSSRAQA